MADWPSTLPQSFEASSYNHDPQLNVIATPMETGPSKLRRRFTSKSKFHSGSMIMSKTLFNDTFEPFFETTLGDGVLEFNFPKPFDQMSTIVVRWVPADPPYQGQQYAPDDVIVTFALEEVP